MKKYFKTQERSVNFYLHFKIFSNCKLFKNDKYILKKKFAAKQKKKEKKLVWISSDNRLRIQQSSDKDFHSVVSLKIIEFSNEEN